MFQQKTFPSVQDNKSVKNKNINFIEYALKYSDITFTFLNDKNKTLKSNKAVLAHRCKYFDNLFSFANNKDKNEIIIHDDALTFECIIDILHDDDVYKYEDINIVNTCIISKIFGNNLDLSSEKINNDNSNICSLYYNIIQKLHEFGLNNIMEKYIQLLCMQTKNIQLLIDLDIYSSKKNHIIKLSKILDSTFILNHIDELTNKNIEFLIDKFGFDELYNKLGINILILDKSYIKNITIENIKFKWNKILELKYKDNNSIYTYDELFEIYISLLNPTINIINKKYIISHKLINILDYKNKNIKFLNPDVNININIPLMEGMKIYYINDIDNIIEHDIIESIKYNNNDNKFKIKNIDQFMNTSFPGNSFPISSYTNEQNITNPNQSHQDTPITFPQNISNIPIPYNNKIPKLPLPQFEPLNSFINNNDDNNDNNNIFEIPYEIVLKNKGIVKFDTTEIIDNLYYVHPNLLHDIHSLHNI